MLKNRKLFYVVLIIALAAVFYYEHRKLDSNLSHIESDLNTEKNQDLAAANRQGINKIDREPSPPNEPAPSATEATAAQSFSTWFAGEANNLEASTNNPAEKESLLKARAQKLTPAEIQFLQKKAVDTKATAKERISAAYLLTLSNSSDSLVQLSQAALSLPFPQEVHSIGETLLGQEKAIRVMAIDELFNRAKTDAALRKQLPEIINKISDPALKQYALRRYQELK